MDMIVGLFRSALLTPWFGAAHLCDMPESVAVVASPRSGNHWFNAIVHKVCIYTQIQDSGVFFGRFNVEFDGAQWMIVRLPVNDFKSLSRRIFVFHLGFEFRQIKVFVFSANNNRFSTS